MINAAFELSPVVERTMPKMLDSDSAPGLYPQVQTHEKLFFKAFFDSIFKLLYCYDKYNIIELLSILGYY